MLEQTRRLLMIDADGRPVEQIEDVINGADEDPRYFERIPALAALADDASAPGYDRFLAVSALTAWSTEAGFRAVESAAKSPLEAPWYGTSVDRRYSVDDTFTMLAESVDNGADFVDLRNTGEQWLAAARSLVRIASVVFYDWQLSYLLRARNMPLLRSEAELAIQEGLEKLATVQMSFPMGPQLADIACALVVIDEAAAVNFGYRIATLDSSRLTLGHLIGIIADGKTPLSADFGEYLATQGGEEIKDLLAGALQDRRSAS